ncbi:MAG TPA: hypothetical protein VJS39_05045, partial [Gemmatimonadaceae bacterium]|nr:hypothetical protein [Gemmatimonadaceae bacterium]
MREDPRMPRAVAEYLANETYDRMRSFNWLEHTFARVTSLDSLRALSTEAAASRWLEAKSEKYESELSRRESPRLYDCP